MEKPNQSNNEMEFEDEDNLQENSDLQIQQNDQQNTELSNNPSDMDVYQEESYDEVPQFIVEAFSYHKDAIQAVKVNPQNRNEILTGGLDNVFNLIDISSGKNNLSKIYEETIAFVDWTNDGSYMIGGCLDNKIYVFDKKDEMKQKYVLEGPDEEFTYLTTHPKGNILLVSSIDGTIWMWNLNNGKVLSTFYGHLGGVNKALFTPNKKIASISDDGTFKIWKFGEQKPEIDISGIKDKKFHQDVVLDMCFHKNKPIVITIGQDETYCISNYEKGEIYYKSQQLGDLQNIEIASIFDSFSIATLEGELWMVDMNKQIFLSQYKHTSGLIKTKFWEDRKLYITSTVNGDLILNGSGQNKNHQIQQILNDDYIHDFDFIDENQICIGAEDSFLYIYDIRKGIFKTDNQLKVQYGLKNKQILSL